MKPQTKSYADKLHDPRWQRVKARVLDRALFACECCGKSDEELQVHHVNYAKGREPWDYPDENFQCLAKTCHKERSKLIECATAALRVRLKHIPTDRLTRVAARMMQEAMEVL